jgi:hypothetical protein
VELPVPRWWRFAVLKVLPPTCRFVVDDSGWDDIDFSVESAALADFPRMNMSDSYYQQLGRVMTLLHVVDNNAPTSVGGGGTPRQPLAPPL